MYNLVGDCAGIRREEILRITKVNATQSEKQFNFTLNGSNATWTMEMKRCFWSRTAAPFSHITRYPNDAANGKQEKENVPFVSELSASASASDSASNASLICSVIYVNMHFMLDAHHAAANERSQR